MTTTHPRRADEQPLWFINNLAIVHVDGETSGGSFGLVELTGRHGDMPPLHVHEREDETFYVLDGRMTLHVPGEVIELEAGQSFLAPRGIAHSYRVESDGARWLILASPAGFEQFVRDAAQPAPEATLPPENIAVDPEELGRIAAGYGIRIIGPPGATP